MNFTRESKHVNKKYFNFRQMKYFNVELLEALKKAGMKTLATAYENCKDMDVGFKRCGDTIVALRLPSEDDTTLKRHVYNPQYAKFRAKYIPEVVFVYYPMTKSMISKKRHIWSNTEIVYEEGKQAFPDKYDPNPYNVCSHGIHFYLTLEAAICHSSDFWTHDGQQRILFTNVINQCIYNL